MASKKPGPLPSAESPQFWREVFLSALAALLAKHDGHLTAEGVTHLAADIADAAVEQLRQRQQQWGRS